MATFGGPRSKGDKNGEIKTVMPIVIGSREVEKSSGTIPGISQSSHGKEEPVIPVQELLMLEFPLPKELWQNNKDAKRCASCNNRFRRIGQA